MFFSSANIHESDILWSNELTWDELFHNLEVDLFPINFFRVFGRELSALEELRVNTAGHDYRLWEVVRNRAINDGEWKKARRAKDGKRVERGWQATEKKESEILLSQESESGQVHPVEIFGQATTVA